MYRWKGIWTRNKIHNENFTVMKRQAQAANDLAEGKKTSFNVSEENDHSNEGRNSEIKLKDELLTNGQTYLPQLSDFCKNILHG